MNVERNCELTRFSQVDVGRLLIATFPGQQIVRGMKAFHLGEDDDRDEYFVTLGPFPSDEERQPTAYDARALRERPVLDVSDQCRFVPSLDPKDISAEIPSARYCIGCVLLLEDRTLLGTKFYTGGSAWVTGYLDVSTGELVFRIDHDRFYLTRRWSLEGLEEDVETTLLFEHSVEIGES